MQCKLKYQAYLIKKDFFYDYWDRFEKFKEVLLSKGKFFNFLTNYEINDGSYDDGNMSLPFGKHLKLKIRKNIIICT